MSKSHNRGSNRPHFAPVPYRRVPARARRITLLADDIAWTPLALSVVLLILCVLVVCMISFAEDELAAYNRSPLCTVHPNVACRTIRGGPVVKRYTIHPPKSSEVAMADIQLSDTLLPIPAGAMNATLTLGTQVTVAFWGKEAVSVSDSSEEMVLDAHPRHKLDLQEGNLVLAAGAFVGLVGWTIFQTRKNRQIRELEARRTAAPFPFRPVTPTSQMPTPPAPRLPAPVPTRPPAATRRLSPPSPPPAVGDARRTRRLSASELPRPVAPPDSPTRRLASRDQQAG